MIIIMIIIIMTSGEREARAQRITERRAEQVSTLQELGQSEHDEDDEDDDDDDDDEDEKQIEAHRNRYLDRSTKKQIKIDKTDINI